MFSASGSPLFSPEADDDDDGNALKLANTAHVLFPIQSTLSGRGIGMERPASPLRCKSSEVARPWDHEAVAQRLLWSNTLLPSSPLALPPSSPLLNSSDAFSDGLDLDFGHIDSCTSKPSKESPPQQQPMTSLADDGNVDPDAKELAAFWSSIEAFLASSSSDSTASLRLVAVP
ncbi:hypothetical protein F5888DRAFT_1800729 [Russula emetica]|nr:hypothetical protein F5888DRAFT_1800729 [Russula emetica]